MRTPARGPEQESATKPLRTNFGNRRFLFKRQDLPPPKSQLGEATALVSLAHLVPGVATHTMGQEAALRLSPWLHPEAWVRRTGVLSLPVRLQQWRPPGQTGLLPVWKNGPKEGRRYRKQMAHTSGETHADSIALLAWGDIFLDQCNQEPLAAVTESQIMPHVCMSCCNI